MYDNLTLKVVCDEPGGRVTRTVSRMPLDTESVLRVYDKLGWCENLFGIRTVQSIEHLVTNYWKFWTVDDVGVLCFDPCEPGYAHVHVTFWDKRLRGREELCRELARCLMRRYNIHTVLTAIPLSARVVTAFVKRVGFIPGTVKDGRQVFIADAGCFTMKHQEV